MPHSVLDRLTSILHHTKIHCLATRFPLFFNAIHFLGSYTTPKYTVWQQGFLSSSTQFTFWVLTPHQNTLFGNRISSLLQRNSLSGFLHHTKIHCLATRFPLFFNAIHFLGSYTTPKYTVWQQVFLSSSTQFTFWVLKQQTNPLIPCNKVSSQL